jgi:hypothetical protein
VEVQPIRPGIWLRFAKTAYGATQHQCDTSMLIFANTSSNAGVGMPAQCTKIGMTGQARHGRQA